MNIDITGMNKTAARTFVRQLTDVSALQAALAGETRTVVRDAIEARIRKLSALTAGDAQPELPLAETEQAAVVANSEVDTPATVEASADSDGGTTAVPEPVAEKRTRKGRTAGLQARTARVEAAEGRKAPKASKARSKRPRGPKAKAPAARTKSAVAPRAKVDVTGIKRQPRHKVDFPKPDPSDANAQAMCTNCHHVGPVGTDFGWRTLKRTRKRDGVEIEVRTHQPRCKPCRGGKASARRQAAGLE